MVKQITTRPPIAPPTTAPRFSEEEEEEEGDEREEDEGVGPDGGDVNKECTTELELDAGTEDVSAAAAVDRNAGLFTELLVAEVELDGIVVVSATVGTGKSLSVFAVAPQAIYS
ncbi:hypothetical protein E8E12_000878 [Didymella heteroderae]|uniref:Uncharacterized protein n=1 Tax=Didymella heteroderae TaxID=1769908 RepID=A0A9P5BY73_9PLEO|nr:hypothetical protein E8E12_000878 [Didymella heteroderae]